MALNPGQPPLDNAAILINSNGQITAFGRNKDFVPQPGEEQVDLGECLLMPGLVNAHCHLDYSMMRGALIGTGGFTDWIARLNSLKRSMTVADYRMAVESGIRESLANGITAMVNIESYPELAVELPRTPLRIWWCLELMDIRVRNAAEEFCLGLMRACENHQPAGRHQFGLSPHAPYTTSLALYQAAATVAAETDLLFTTHVSESSDEIEMFALSRGNLYDLVNSVGSLHPTGNSTPLAYLADNLVLPDGALLAHMNGLIESDFQWLERRVEDGLINAVHCPQSHAFFDHPEFAADRLRDVGVNICLGTDSLASSQSLSLFDEMSAFAATYPGWSPADILQLATVNAAAAVGCSDTLGSLAEGFQADCIAIPCPESVTDPYEAILNHTGPVKHCWIAGREVQVPQAAF